MTLLSDVQSYFINDVFAPSPYGTIDLHKTPEQFSASYHKILNKQDTLMPFAYNDIQRIMTRNMSGMDLILKPRQVGISTWVLSRIHHMALQSTLRALVLMDIDENTASSRMIFQRYHDELPRLSGIPSIIRNSGVRVQFSNDSLVMLRTARSDTAGRSFTARVFFGDEFHHYRNPDNVLRGALQAGSPEWVVLASTSNGAQGLFYEFAMKALKDPRNSPYKLHFFEWWLERQYALALEYDETLDYDSEELRLIKKHNLTAEQIKWRRLKIAQLGTVEDFLQEYPEDPVSCFQASGNAFFSFPSGAFTSDTTYNPNDTHYAGIDWGQARDYTVMIIINQHGEMKAFYRNNRTDYRVMRDDMIKLMIEYNVQVCVPEVNSAETNIEDLLSEIRQAGANIRVTPLRMTHQTKMFMLNNLAKAIREGGFKLLDIPVLQGEFNSVQKRQKSDNSWVAEDSTGHTPDTVMSAGLALYGLLSVPAWSSKA